MRERFHALILAAGKGTRFESEKNKILHPLMGRSMLHWVVESVLCLKPEQVYVVVGFQKEEVMKEPFAKKVHFVTQKEQLGTAHAVLAAKSVLQKNSSKNLLVINGDLPLIRPETLRPLLREHQLKDNSLTFLSADLEDPFGFGRIVRQPNEPIKVVEEKDASPSQRKFKEINVGIYLFKIRDLLEALPRISKENKKKEYYLTDIIQILAEEKKKIGVYKTAFADEIVGVNDRHELSRAADVLRKRKIKTLTDAGVTVYDPSAAWIDCDVRIGRDTTIYPSVIIEGKVSIGESCTLYPFVHLKNTKVGNHVKILSSTMIEGSVLEDGVNVGPFAHIRPKSILKQDSKVGNFVEMKNTVFGKASKAGHLSYLGDSDVEEEVNIGAGTITCNYDGLKKHRTLIGAGAFIGSGTELVAPVKIGKKAYVGAGSTITKDVSPESLAVSRSRQVEKPGWAKRKQKK